MCSEFRKDEEMKLNLIDGVPKFVVLSRSDAKYCCKLGGDDDEEKEEEMRLLMIS